MPSKSIHLKNVIKIAIGEMKKKKKRSTRRRRLTTASSVGVNQAHKLLSEIQSLSKIYNVANPQASNSATLLHKVTENETNNKIKSLENQLHHFHNNIPRLPPSTSSNRGLLDYQPQQQTTLTDYAYGLVRDQERLNRLLRNVPQWNSSMAVASERPRIEALETPPSTPRVEEEAKETETAPSPPRLRRSFSGGGLIETTTPPLTNEDRKKILATGTSKDAMWNLVKKYGINVVHYQKSGETNYQPAYVASVRNTNYIGKKYMVEALKKKFNLE